ncbi:amino acid ABC transporter ATP-binding/permease protein [Schleiferilactobacillus perolens]|jgi:ATP-binding cassette subfamily C protein|uniref:amino acid ABC transporter ATP-binding/permease protein n=1 Tax=Schleiferilactobacillus perolens TaxID=100468 RepID=UPI0023573E4B|nr:ABC transporter ATP-binding protein [Schleiferilactobacillus perolens]MCI2171800.1 ABC transporter ATP-binding protein/permease [Schleiferilactobacillus perolens]
MIKRMVAYVRYLLPVLILSWLAGMVAELGQVFVAWQTGRILISPSTQLQSLAWVLVAGVILAALCAFAEQYAGHYVAFKVLADLRNTVYAKVERLAPAGLSAKRSGDLLKAVGSDIEAMEVFYAHTLVPIAIGIGFTIILAVGYAQISLAAAVVMLLVASVIGFALPFFKYHQLAQANAQLATVQATTQQEMLEAVRGRDALLQLAAVDQQMQTVDDQYQEEAPAQQKVGLLNWQKNWLAWVIILASWLLLAAWIGVQTNFSRTLVPLLLAFPFSFRPLLALSSLPDALSKGLGATRRIFALLDTPEPVTNTGEVKLARPIDEIAVDHLTFAYPERSQTILEDVSLTLHSGQIGGIIGESGAGKSTLVKLLMKWYPAPVGTIRINDLSITDIQTQSLWQRINYLPQQAQIFHTTIQQNLTLGDTEITDPAITRVLEQVKLTHRIAQLPQGLQTIIDPTAPALSAGELQRLALARAFLHPSSLLILDEPTSNLDVLNEKIILTSVKHYYFGMVLMITHRSETLGVCDVVWRLQDSHLTVVSER